MIYLNNAATSFPKPQSVIDAVLKAIQNPVLHSARTGLERELNNPVFNARQNLARLFNVADPLQIIFTSGSTEALNMVINGLQMNGGNVVTTVTEHNSVLRPLKTLEKDGKISVTIVGCDQFGYVNPSDIKKALNQNTQLVVVNFVSNVNGTKQDIAEITKIAHEAGSLILVDASQAAGNVPIDFSGWDADFMAFTGHKSLHGLQGIGGLVIKSGLKLKPIKVGGTGIHSSLQYQPEGMPIYYEAGTQNFPGIISLLAGTDFILSEGFEKLSNHKTSLIKKLISEMSNLQNVKIYNHPIYSSNSVVCFNVKGLTPEETGYILNESYDIIVRSGLHCAPLMASALDASDYGTVRISPSYFNTEKEIDKCLMAINEISANFGN